jgi:hypothetical protein
MVEGVDMGCSVRWGMLWEVRADEWFSAYSARSLVSESRKLGISPVRVEDDDAVYARHVGGGCMRGSE